MNHSQLSDAVDVTPTIEDSPYCHARDMVQLLFPPNSRALAFFDALVQLASSQAHLFAGLQDGYLHIAIPGYKELQATLGFSYETTHMYTILFQAVGIVFVEREQSQLRLFLPLGDYFLYHDVLSLLDDLSQHYTERRPKMGKMIRYLIQRLLQVQDAHRFTFYSEKHSRVLYQQEPLYAPMPSTSDHVSTGVPINASEPAPTSQQTNLPAASTGGEEPSLLNQEPIVFEKEIIHDTRNTPVSLEDMASPPQNSPTDPVISMSCSASRKDQVERQTTVKADVRVDLKVDSGVDSQVDSQVDSWIDSSKNGNGIDTINNTTLLSHNDPVPVLSDQTQDNNQTKDEVQTHASLRHHAERIATIIEGQTTNLGAYFVLQKHSSPNIVRAAVIATLLRQHFPQGQGPLKRPGGFFTHQVHTLQNDAEQVHLLLQAYANLSYEQIERLLRTQSQEQGSDLRLYHPLKGTMLSQQQAHHLAQQIAGDDPRIEVLEIQPVPYSPAGSYVVAVLISGLRHIFASTEDWNAYHQTTQSIHRWEQAKKQKQCS